MKKAPQPNSAVAELDKEAELPEGWADIALEEIGRLHCGQSPATRFVNTDGRGTPYVTGPDQWDGRELRVHKWTTDPRRIIPAGCVFITVKGAGVGTIFPGVPAAIGRDVYAYEPASTLSYRFVMRALELTISEIKRQAAGDIPGLSKDHILTHVIGLPPIKEQERILSAIGFLFLCVQKSTDRLAKVPKILKAFRQSVLAAACSGRLTEDWRGKDAHAELSESELPQKWRAGELAELCASIADGDHQPPPKQSQGIPFLVIGNISSGALEFGGTRFVSDGYFKRIKPERIPRRGDVLYTVVGATIGIPVVVDTDRPFCFQRHIAILKPAPTTSTGYLCLVMESRDVFRQAWEGVTGSAQPTLPLGNLRRLTVPIPPLEEQQEIVRRVEALFKLADAIEKRVEAATKRADKLTQSILAKAFRGELVPTEAELARKEGRTYEPASELLARVRSAREKAAATPTVSKRGRAVSGKK
jgi:type I restriction enzyme S subunit